MLKIELKLFFIFRKLNVALMLLAIGQVALSAEPTTAKNQNTIQASSTNEVLAKAPGDLVVTVADILSEVNKMPPASRPQFFSKPENVHQLTNNLMGRRLLAKEAERDQLNKDEIVKAALAVAHDRVMSDAKLNKMDQLNEPSPAAVEAYSKSLYQSKPERFEVPAQIRASHILIEKKDEKSLGQAEALLAKIKAGGKFEELAKELSKDPGSAARGGDLGFFGEGKMIKEFEDAVKKLEKAGELSPIVESQFGYHIIRLEERKPKTTMTFEEVKSQLFAESRTAILSDKRTQKVDSITKQINFDTQAILKMTREASQALGLK